MHTEFEDDNDDLKEFKVFDKSYALPYHDSGSATKNDILMAATIQFAKKGYAAVSMKDIADAVGIQPASLYNHFAGKETMWKAVLAHARDLHLLFLGHMEEQLEKAKTFEEVLDILFAEPEKMENQFTCYAFALVQAEQFRDELASAVFRDCLIKATVDQLKRTFDKCVADGLVAAFDAMTVACMYSCNVLIGINLSVQKLLGRQVPYEPGEMIARLHRQILEIVDIPR